MQIRNILSKSLLLAALCSNTLAASSSRDDCKELNKAINSKFECKTNDKGEMIELNCDAYGRDENDHSWIKKIFSYKTIEKLTYKDEYNDCEPLQYGLSNLKNLKELNIRSFRGGLIEGVLKDLKSLKKFTFGTGDHVDGLSPENLKELSKLPNLEYLGLDSSSIGEEGAEYLKNTKISKVYLSGNGNTHMSSGLLVKVLKELKELTVKGTKVFQEDVDIIVKSKLEKLIINLTNDSGKTYNIDGFKNLKTLTYLDIRYEEEKVPDVLYSIPNLKTLIYNGKEIDLNNNYGKISTNGKCGPKDGKCPKSECCSKYGYCGTSDKHCYSGCQSEFGKCKSSSIPTSTNGKCGSKDGKCPKNECCSKYGYCGTSDKHCYSGCQSEFGKCR